MCFLEQHWACARNNDQHSQILEVRRTFGKTPATESESYLSAKTNMNIDFSDQRENNQKVQAEARGLG